MAGNALSNLTNNLGGGVNLTGGGTAGRVYAGKTKVYSGTELVERDATIPVSEAKKNYMKDPAVRAKWAAQLAKAGFSNNDPIKNRQLYEMSVDGASDWYYTSDGTQKITPEQYLMWNAKGQKKENIPSRQVYLYDPATINGLIDDALSNSLGRKATASEQKEFYTAIEKMIAEGTVTTTKTRINPQTGKKESYTETKPGFTKEAATAMIEEKVKAESPEDYQQKKSLEFADFLFGLK